MTGDNAQIQYGYDRVRINSYEPFNSLRARIPEKEIKNLCYSFDLRPFPKYRLKERDRKKIKWRSVIDMVCPSITCLERLLEYENFLPDGRPATRWYYRISRLEIFKYTLCRDPEEAIRHLDKLGKTLGMKRANKSASHDNYEAFVNNDRSWKPPKPGIFSEVTWCYRNRKLEYETYGRYSKKNGEPCLEEEWRLKGAPSIKGQTQISTIQDLIHSKPEFLFCKLNESYILRGRINCLKLGKWLLGWSRGKQCGDREIVKAIVQAGIFCRANHIKNPADLAIYFNNRKEEIRHKRGVRSSRTKEWQKTSWMQFVELL